ncbi:MAG: hypothetical protein H7222_08050 [Methylotenera sp.]|nr:hypothetical protein [Oligoflexia bacterium]
MADTRDSASEEMIENETTAADACGTEPALFSPSFGTAKEVVQRYTHCVICNGNLHFNHQTDFSRNLTQETAKCPECGIKVRSVIHRLQ